MSETPQPRPEGLPEKFNSVADLANAYGELERKQSAAPPSIPDPTPAPPITPQPPPPAAPQAPAAIEDAALAKYNQEIATTGALSEASYTELAGKGIHRQMVDGYIEGVRAQAQQIVSQTYERAGGQEQWNAMVQWASQALPAEEVAAFNNAMAGQDANVRNLALDGLRARYESRSESAGLQAVAPSGGPQPGAKPYSSVDEWHADQFTPEYHNNETKRQQVRARLAATLKLDPNFGA